jgi:hypothetical protein
VLRARLRASRCFDSLRCANESHFEPVERRKNLSEFGEKV